MNTFCWFIMQGLQYTIFDPQNFFFSKSYTLYLKEHRSWSVGFWWEGVGGWAWRHCFMVLILHARIQKVLSEGSNYDVFFFFSWWGEGGSKCHYKWTIIGPPAKRHWNGISLECQWWLNIVCWGSGPVMVRNPIFLWFSRGWGGGVQTPCSPSGSAHVLLA